MEEEDRVDLATTWRMKTELTWLSHGEEDRVDLATKWRRKTELT